MSSAAAQKREKKRLENEQKIQQAVQTLRQVSESDITPKNIRRDVRQAITTLGNSKISQGIRAADSIAILEGLARDPNIPSSSRVVIWSAISILESVREA
ncbi:MAG: UPF0147 family protein [Nitrososphaerales archaeon]